MTLPPRPPGRRAAQLPAVAPHARRRCGSHYRVMGLQRRSRPSPGGARRAGLAWGLWDWALAAFNAVVPTFVFTALYLTSDTFLDPAVAALGEGDPAYERALAELASALGWALTIAGSSSRCSPRSRASAPTSRAAQALARR